MQCVGAPTSGAAKEEFAIPAGACDCHVHVFDPIQFPYASDRIYTPPEATLADLSGLQRMLHMERVVVVAPSVYGEDDCCTLNAVSRLGSSSCAVIASRKSFSRGELEDLWGRGARGVRVNFETTANTNVDEGRRALDAIAERLPHSGWHIQFDTRLSVIGALSDHLAQLPCQAVFSHFARARAALGPAQPGFDDLQWLVASGKAYVKISAPYRISDKAPHFEDVELIARSLIAANVDRMLWGSNWPHPGRGATHTAVAPPYPNDDFHVLSLLGRWIPEPSVRRKVLVENPARLYGFNQQEAAKQDASALPGIRR
jgi:predicted TIM-barrel fold metal-dependent hydrolase